jgi:hypothetical protein
MATPFANTRPRLAVDAVARWLDEVAAGPIMLAIAIVATVATIVRIS